MRALRSFVLSGAALVAGCTFAACGGAAPAPASSATPGGGASSPLPSASASVTAAPSTWASDGAPRESLPRSIVLAGIKAGLGRFLAYVEVDPVLETKGGKRSFVGWRVTKLRGPVGTWDGVDVQVGDTVLRVNGFKIERDFQADAAFRSLAVASEIRVSLVRDGKPIELRFSISDDTPTSASSVDSPRATTVH